MDGDIKKRRHSILIELAAVTSILMVIVRALFLAKSNPIIGQALSAIVAILFLYAPIFVLWRKKRPLDFTDRGWPQYRKSFLVFLVTSVIVFPPFLVGAHLWQLFVMGYKHFYFAGFPNALQVMAFQLLLVALPEEFYFRGYFQSALNLVFERRWNVLGVKLGPAWIITAVVFAICHSIVFYQWWHFSIFFPALVFGYLRERMGTITAPILFHAASNIMMDFFVRSYS